MSHIQQNIHNRISDKIKVTEGKTSLREKCLYYRISKGRNA